MKTKTLRNLCIVISATVLTFLLTAYFTGDGKYVKYKGHKLRPEALGQHDYNRLKEISESGYDFNYFYGGIAGGIVLFGLSIILLRPEKPKQL